jgi:hypothetical protein
MGWSDSKGECVSDLPEVEGMAKVQVHLTTEQSVDERAL